MMATWALFDTSWLAYRSRYSMGALSHDELPTGVIYGFFEQLRTVCFDPRVQTNKVALCFDAGTSIRKLAFPDYKRKRAEERTPEEWAEIKIMKDQLKRLRLEILPSIGFRTYRQAGLESDDMLAQAAKQLREHPAFIVTADQDLFQCISFVHHWFDPSRDLVVTWADLMNRKGLWPNQWGIAKCLSGCDTDNVPGVPGVGLKTAALYLNGKLPRTHKRYQAIISSAGVDIVERNKPLILLPHAETKELDMAPPQYNYGAFENWCRALGMKSYLQGGREVLWKRFFEGNMDGNRQVARMRKSSC